MHHGGEFFQWLSAHQHDWKVPALPCHFSPLLRILRCCCFSTGVSLGYLDEQPWVDLASSMKLALILEDKGKNRPRKVGHGICSFPLMTLHVLLSSRPFRFFSAWLIRFYTFPLAVRLGDLADDDMYEALGTVRVDWKCCAHGCHQNSSALEEVTLSFILVNKSSVA